MEITQKLVEDVAAEFGLKAGAEGGEVWTLVAGFVEAHQRFLAAGEALRAYRAKAGYPDEALPLVNVTSGPAGFEFDDTVAAVRQARAVLAAAGAAQRAATPAPELAEKDRVRWTAPWEPTNRTGTVMQVRDGMVWIQQDDADGVWVTGVDQVAKIEPAKAADHLDCRGFDNQEFYWHCYTHELYRQEF